MGSYPLDYWLQLALILIVNGLGIYWTAGGKWPRWTRVWD